MSEHFLIVAHFRTVADKVHGERLPPAVRRHTPFAALHQANLLALCSSEWKRSALAVDTSRPLTQALMTLQWIAESLCMGSWTYVSNLLRPNAATTKCVRSEDWPLSLHGSPES